MEGSSKAHYSAEKHRKQKQLLQNQQKTSMENELRTTIRMVYEKRQFIMRRELLSYSRQEQRLVNLVISARCSRK